MTADWASFIRPMPASASSSMRVEHLPLEGSGLRRRLDLDELAAAGHDHVHIHLGDGVLCVLQVDDGLAAHDAHADRGHGIGQGQRSS